MEHWPEMFRELMEFQALADALDPEFQALGAAIDDFLMAQFIETAPEWAVRRREEMLELMPSTDMDYRKKRLSTCWGAPPPYNLTSITAVLERLVGAGKVNMSLLNRTLTLELGPQNPGEMSQAIATVREMVPANVLVRVMPTAVTRITPHFTITLTQTLPMALGRWALGEYAFTGKRETKEVEYT